MKTIRLQNLFKTFWPLALLSLLATGQMAYSATIVWTNTLGGNWSVAANWNPNQVPGASDTAQITTSGTYTVTNSGAASVSVLTLGGASGTQTLNLSSGTFTVGSASAGNAQGVLILTGGTLAGAGALILAGPFNWSSGTINNTGGVTLNGTSSLDGASAAAMTLSGLLINAGALTWSGVANNFYNEGTLTNLASGTITITADVSSPTGGTFGNAGLLSKTTTTGTTTLTGPLVNTGNVEVQSGTLDLDGNGSANATGTFEVSSGATLQFGQGYTLSLGSSVTGAGSVTFSGGAINASGTYDPTGGNTFSGATVNFSGNYTITGQAVTLSAGAVNFNAGGTVNLTGLTLSGGTLGGTLPVPVNGPFNWSSGTINNTGGVTLNGTSSLDGASAAAMTLSGLLINAGALTWSGVANNFYNEGTLTNLASGTITITADVSSPTGGTFGNAGLLSKTTTTGTTTLTGPLVNTGNVEVQSGTLDLDGNGSANATGTFEVSSGATLQFGQGYTLSLGSSVTGAGSVTFSGGAINASGTYDPTGGNTFSGATVNFSGNYTITGQAVTLSAGAVNFNAGGTVNLTGLTLSGGTLGGTLPVPVNGPFNWSSGTINNTGGVTLNGTSSLDGASAAAMTLSGLLINAGALTWSGVANNFYNEGTLTNLASGTITITADVSSPTGGTFGNAGLLSKTTTTGTTTLTGPLVNTGNVEVQSGTLDLDGNGSANATGTFEVSSGATLQFGQGYTLSLGSSVTGAGSVTFSGGAINASGTYDPTGGNTFSGATVNFSGNYTITGQAVTLSAGAVNFNAGGTVNLTGLTLSGGTLGGTLPVPVNGPFNWSSGTINNTGGVTLNGTSSLDGASAAAMTLSGLLINAGALTWSGVANNFYNEGTLTNLASGTITITADVSSPTGGTFGNAGLLSKTTTTGTTTLTGPLVNTGTLNVQSGIISLAGSHTLTNGKLNIGISNVTSFGSVSLSGAAALTGTLSANFNAGFLPAVNNSWQIINYTSPSGVFTQTNLPPVAIWQVTTNPTFLTIKVLKLVPQVSWPTPADIVYGTALSAAQLDATATWNGSAVAGTFTYNPPSGTVLDSGSNQTLSVTFTPSDPSTYTSVSTNVTINVQQAPLGITANSTNKTYGQNFSFAGTEFTTSGLTNGDTVTSASLASAGAISNAPVSGSPYAITISNALGDAGLTNYSITYTNGLLTVGKAMLTIMAASTNKIAGETWTFAGTEFTASGLQNGETIGTVMLTSAGAASSAPPGPYSIVPSAPVGGTFSQGNYTNQFVDGTLTVLGTPDLTLTLLGDQYVLTFPSVSGQMYQVQSKTNLAVAGWSSLGGSITGTGGTVNVTNTIVVPQSFFQLEIAP